MYIRSAMSQFSEAPTVREQPARATERESLVQVDASPFESLRRPERYRVGDRLGLGGMGEVRRCHDARVGRDVAMKTVRADAAGVAFVRERFLREARVQGQLEHPCIVPVYDIGLGDDGEAYFTMKRVRGVTLEHVVDGLRARDAALTARWSRRRLLAAFATVCGAVHYAHTRGVVHRDLKPGNIMLGDFGEVYVLDWGVARVLDAPDDVQAEPVDAPVPEAGRTAAGAVVGTAGYMPLEQIAGDPGLDGRADVYALGAILFEVLALEPLHAGGSVQALLASTITGADARASVRAPDRDVPPELDAICARATAKERAGRFASAGELLDAVERYLDGDRDLERRRAMASALATDADADAAKALGGDDAARAAAMRGVGQALALDAGNVSALRTFVRLLVEPPREVPPEVEARMHEDSVARRLQFYRGGAAACAVWLALSGLALWVGVRDAAAYGLMVASVAGAGAACALVARTGRYYLEARLPVLALFVAAVAASGRIFGPFVLVPALAVVVTTVFSLTPDPGWRRLFLGAGSAGVVAPVLVELSGLAAPSYVLRDGVIELHARMTALPPLPIFVSLVLVHLGVLAVTAELASRTRDAFDAAARRVYVQAWQLRQIVPREPSDA